ncbi:MAG TPA: DUF4097 family beta strand repeat-containing protein [Acidobacteriota bacterium]|nr:DUF4097 family beta strand repeat-containing protein [Acidobacteriota bacterium]
MKFRQILLVVFLVLASFVLYQFKTGNWNVDGDWGWWNWDGWGGREVAAEETQTIEGPVPPVMAVENGHGWVEIRGADQDAIQLTFKKVAWRRSEEEAKDIVARLKYTVTKAPDKLTLTTNRDEFPRKNFETAFVLTVPRTMAVRVVNGYGAVRIDGVAEATVRNSHGEVFVTEVKGRCEVETSYEDVEVQRVTGECRIINTHADVRAGSVGGNLTIETSYAEAHVEDAGGTADIRGTNVDVEARRVAGAVTVDTTYEKVLLADVGPADITARHSSVTADGVRGDLKVRTSYAPIQATRVQGNLLISAENAAVNADGVAGDKIEVTTSYEKVTLTGFSAEVTVSNRNGDVSLGPLDLKHGIDVRNEYGDIALAWPDGETARLEAETKGGNIHWGLEAKPDVERSNGTSLIKAFSASPAAPLIFLSTRYSDVRVDPAARKF